jgi:hypothetical protein
MYFYNLYLVGGAKLNGSRQPDIYLGLSYLSLAFAEITQKALAAIYGKELIMVCKETWCPHGVRNKNITDGMG